jgi:hypothetical protein
MAEFLTTALEATNEILAAAIVVLAFSMLLYNLTRDLNNRIARTSGAVLACVTIPYLVDVFVSFRPETDVAVAAIRLQWIGIAFIPAALFHLSDVLLATTGLPSRGRRKRAVRFLYVISALLLILALFTDTIIRPVPFFTNINIESGNFAWLYVTYFISASIATFINMQRARLRALTHSTRRRMAYLQFAILTPAIGIFPFSLFITEAQEHTLPIVALVIVTNLIVIGMLIFLSYPLSFFGSNKPDRVVKIELLHFLLRGPGTGLLALAVIVFTSRATNILGLDNEDFLPFAVVAVVLMWQWGIALGTPYLEKLLIYRGEDAEQLAKLEDLGERILTRNDLLQLSEATLEAVCDALRVEVAFLISVKDTEAELVQSVGTVNLSDVMSDHEDELQNIITIANKTNGTHQWGEYQLFSLHGEDDDTDNRIVGFLGVQTLPEIQEDLEPGTLEAFKKRAEQTLYDIRLQAEIFAALEGLLPQIPTTRDDATEFISTPTTLQDKTKQYNKEEIYEQVRAALRQYWGGPGIASSRLRELKIVQSMTKTDTATNALRNILEQAIEKQRPEGERSMTSPEWTIYNILTLRFLEGKKVRDVARRMSMSEADLFRKQRSSIEAVADTLLEMEEKFQ